MIKTVFFLISLNLLTGLFVSCSSSPSNAEIEALLNRIKPVEPVQKSEVAKETKPVVTEDATSGFRMLKNDIALPTASQLADGANGSDGYSQSNGGDSEDKSPTTTVKPPRVIHEDQLAPSE